MPIRGENVGRAYVTIYGDGSGLPDDIRDALNDAEPSIREAGREHADAYDAAVTKRIRDSFRGNFGGALKSEMLEGANDALTNTVARLELSDRFFKSDDWKEFRTRLTHEFDDAGTLAGERLERSIRDSTNLEGLSGAIKRIGPDVRRAQKDLLTAMYDDAYEMNKQHDRRIAGLLDDREEEYQRHIARQQDLIQSHLDYMADRDEAYDLHWKQLSAERDYIFERDLKAQQERIDSHLEYIAQRNEAYHENEMRMEREQQRLQKLGAMMANAQAEDKRRNLAVLRESYEDLTFAVKELQKGELGSGRSRRTLIRDIEGLRSRLAQLDPNSNLTNDFERLDRQIRTLHPLTNRLDRDFRRLGDGLGTITGRGSRNNFLNFTGSMVRNLTNLITLVPRLAMKIGTTVGDAFSKGASTMGGFLQVAALIPPALGMAALGLAGLAAAVAILLVVLAPLVALFSGLLGIITALAGTISFALVGALAAVAGLLAPIAAGIGVVIFGLTNLSNKMVKQLKADTKELRNEFSSLGEDIGGVLVKNADRISDALVPVLKTIRPLLLDIADAAQGVVMDWAERLDSPGFRTFIDRIDKFLPNAVERLGTILGNTFGGFGGILTGMIPLLNEFLGWLEDITENFNEWANSKQGQKEIREFFRDAADSAKSLGGFLKDAWDFLRLLLSEGKGTGDSIFERMGNSIERFTKYLRDNPDALKDWFKNAEDLAIALGELLIELGKFLDKLDSSPSRKAVTSFIGFLVKIGSAADKLAGILGSIQGIRWGRVIGGNIGVRLANIASTGIGRALLRIGATVQRLPGIVRGAISAIPAIVVGIASRIPQPFQQAVARAGRFFTSLPGRVRGILSGLPGIVGIIAGRMVSAIQNTPDRIVNFFTGLPGRISATLSNAPTLVGLVAGRIVSAFQGVPDRIVGFFAGLAGRIVAAIGPINIPMPNMPDPGGGIPYVPGVATGGLFGRITNGPMLRWVGEDGPEAIVPLARDLSQVDPAVRALSAIAQGKMGLATQGKTIDASGWTIVTPSEDPYAVAHEVVNTMTAAAYGN